MPKLSKIKKEILHTPKGTRDIMPAEIAVWEHIEAKAKEIAEFYGFRPIRTPHIEKTELFLRTLGEASDIVEKQMYAFRTRGKDSLTLRPEGTAPIMRAYLEQGMKTWPQPVMLYYLGSFFRHERPQKSRWREFGQFGLEILGTESPVSDALIIRLFMLIADELGIAPVRVHVNTLGDKKCRVEHRRDLVGHFRKKINYLCKDCRKRLTSNPLRLLDCAQEKCQELAKDAPQLIEYVCDDCKTHFRKVIEFLDAAGIPYFLDHRLVRGLDYYSRTVFEIFLEEAHEKAHDMPDIPKETSAADIQANTAPNEDAEHASPRPLAIASGGRYDDLAFELGMKEPHDDAESQWKGAVGGAIGLDRIAEILYVKKETFVKGGKEGKGIPSVFLIQLGTQAKQQSFLLLEQFRKNRLAVASSLSKDSLKNQLEHAAGLGVSHTIILGQKEVIDKTAIVRDMETGMQETIPQEKLIDYMKKKKKT